MYVVDDYIVPGELYFMKDLLFLAKECYLFSHKSRNVFIITCTANGFIFTCKLGLFL